MRFALYLALLASLILMGCSDKPSLQHYFVDNAEKKNFMAFDLSSSILNTDKATLTAEQKEALQSFDKMNVLAFKMDKNNEATYLKESQKVSAILKGEPYQELMKIGSGSDGASLQIVGDGKKIDEFVFFAKRKKNGFAVVRILGNDMNPTKIVNLISVLQSSKLNMDQLKPLQDLLQ